MVLQAVFPEVCLHDFNVGSHGTCPKHEQVHSFTYCVENMKKLARLLGEDSQQSELVGPLHDLV